MTATQLIAAIKKKKELQGIDDAVVERELQNVLTQHPSWNDDLSKPRSAIYALILKAVRASLRRKYGLFRTELLPPDLSPQELLSRHSSTKERLPFYQAMYQSIFNITGKPATILDLGCGLNPLSLPFMELKKVNYFAYDISKNEVDVLNKFFNSLPKNSLWKGKAQILDITDVEKVLGLPIADICFLFKVTDIVDRGHGHKRSEELMKAIPSHWVIVSFPTHTMSGKPMTAPRRKWMEWMCARLGWSYATFEFENEIVYVVKKG